ncbi:retrovirus-related pol polyprotein from transposon TNT 1-94 [Tanacetum coccineum]|uniref:Retrovirus-related pol polyprotein from transposon TNT 1-94 n=1 Tax=Tanacetum coccineum TaxID=301880 RepID=A0ABQ5A0Q1_9ASTR
MNSPAVPEQTTVETVLNMSPVNKAHFESEKEAIHLILTGIGDEIYSTVDACKTTQEMWEAIERIQQEWSRFVTIVKQQHKLDEVSYHKLFDILKQYQKEVNELCAERMAKNSNPLALVATTQTLQDPYYQSSKSYKSFTPTSKVSIPTRTHATTRHKGKEIAKPITPSSESASEEDSDPEQAQKDKEMQKNLALIAKYFKKLYKPTNNNLRTSSNTRKKYVDTTPRYKNDNQPVQFGNQRTMTVTGARETVGSQVVQQSRIQCFNYKEFGHFAKECRKPKRVKDPTYHKEKMLLCKQAEKGVQYDTGYNMFANEIQHSEQSESISNTCVVETGDSNVILDSPDMCDNDIQNNQNAIECDDERVALANLIANLKLDVDENKKIQKQLKKTNASLTQELTEELVDQAWVKHSNNHINLRAPTAQDMQILIKTQNDSFAFVHELKQEMHADLKEILDYNAFIFIKSFAKLEKHSISLGKWLLYKNCQEQLNNDKTAKKRPTNVFRKDVNIIGIQDLKAQLQDKNIAIRVAHKTNFRRPQPRSNQMKDKVVPNTSQVKVLEDEYEEHLGFIVFLIIQSRFDEIKEMSETSVANDTSGLVPQRQKASDYDNPDPAPELQNVSPSADTTVPSQQELDLLFGPLYDEFFNDGTSRVNKSSSPTDNSALQDTHPSTNIHPTSELTTQTNVHAEENNDNQAEFTNPFCHRYTNMLSLPHAILVIQMCIPSINLKINQP